MKLKNNSRLIIIIIIIVVVATKGLTVAVAEVPIIKPVEEETIVAMVVSTVLPECISITATIE
jgi:hypothetical protein